MNEALTTVATFNTPVEAELARNRLEERGIAAVVTDAETVGMLFHLGGALGGVKVQVAESDADRARAILAARSGRAALAAGDDYGVERGPARRHSPARLEPAAEDEPASESESEEVAARAWRAAVIGLLMLPPLLHFYSAWLLFQLPWTHGALSPGGKRKVFSAVGLNLLVLFGLVLLLRALTTPPPPHPDGFPPPHERQGPVQIPLPRF